METQCWICPYCSDDHDRRFEPRCRDAFERGRAEVTAEIVAWLNDLVAYEPWKFEQPKHPLAALSVVAGMISRGEHIAANSKRIDSGVCAGKALAEIEAAKKGWSIRDASAVAEPPRLSKPLDYDVEPMTVGQLIATLQSLPLEAQEYTTLATWVEIVATNWGPARDGSRVMWCHIHGA